MAQTKTRKKHEKKHKIAHPGLGDNSSKIPKIRKNGLKRTFSSPHTSIGGQLLGFEMYRSRGEKEKLGRKRQKKRKTRKEKHKFTATFE